jgi:hypothetical protein
MANGRRRGVTALVGLVAAGMISTAGVASAGPIDLSDPVGGVSDFLNGTLGSLGGLLGGAGDAVEVPEIELPEVPTPTTSSTTTSSTQTSRPDTTNIIVVPPAYYGPGNPYYGYGAPVVRANDLNCIDFADTADAQAVLISDPSDPNNLDGDNDGQACDRGVGGVDYTGYPVGGIAAGDGSDSGPNVGQVAFLAIAAIGAGAGVVRGQPEGVDHHLRRLGHALEGLGPAERLSDADDDWGTGVQGHGTWIVDSPPSTSSCCAPATSADRRSPRPSCASGWSTWVSMPGFARPGSCERVSPRASTGRRSCRRGASTSPRTAAARSVARSFSAPIWW